MQASYRFGLIAAAASVVCKPCSLFLVHKPQPEQRNTTGILDLSGMLGALKDKILVHMLAASALQETCARMVWVLGAVYAKTNFGINEVQYGVIPTTNAVMVVLLQVLMMRFTSKYRQPAVMGVGAAFYMASQLLLALTSGFWGMWIAMVVMSIGDWSSPQPPIIHGQPGAR